MQVQHAHLSALQEVVILLEILGRHAKDPVMIAYYGFLSRNLREHTSTLTKEPHYPKKTFEQLLMNPSEN